MILKYFLSFSFLFLLTLECLNAQTRDTISTIQNIKEIKVTSDSNKLSSTLSSTPLQTLSASEIANIGIQSVADAIRRFNGVVVKDYGGIGGFKTISIRGNGAEHTAILYDGVAISNAQSGQIDLGQFSLNNVDMLTLSVGHNNNIFKTARAIASVGALEIVTTTPHFDKKNYQAQVQVKTGAWGLFNSYLYYARKLSDSFSFSVDGSWQRSDGQYSYKRLNGDYVEKGKRKNSDVDILRTELNLFGNITPSQSLSFKAYLFDSERGLPGAVILYNADNGKERLWDKIYFLQGRYDNRLNDRFNFQIQSKFTHNYSKYIENPKDEKNSRYYQNEFYLNGTLLYKLSDELSFSFAEDFSYNTLNANYKGFAYPDRYTSLSALSGKYENEYLTIVGNILGTYAKENVEVGESPDDRKKLSPALSFSYRPFSSANLRLRASYKNIFRVPTFNDLYYARLGSRSLVPENTQQYNVGVTWANSFSESFDFLNFTSDFFYNTVKDKIVTYPTTFESRMVNLGKVRIKGFELKTNAHFNLSNKIGLQASANYTYQKAIDVTNSEAKNYKDQIPYTPVHSGGMSFSVENPWLNFAYSVVAASKSYSSMSNSDWYKVDGYVDHTISVNKSIDVSSYLIRLQADITNISNKTYYIVKDYPMPGRAYRISVSVNF